MNAHEKRKAYIRQHVRTLLDDDAEYQQACRELDTMSATEVLKEYLAREWDTVMRRVKGRKV
jgi:hypothetical protein